MSANEEEASIPSWALWGVRSRFYTSPGAQLDDYRSSSEEERADETPNLTGRNNAIIMSWLTV